MCLKHHCPVCHGSGRILALSFESTSSRTVQCPICKGKAYNNSLMNVDYDKIEEVSLEDTSNVIIDQDFEVLLLRDLLLF